jgi:WD40 repeat protein
VINLLASPLRFAAFHFAWIAFTVASVSVAEESPPSDPEAKPAPVSFHRDVLPIFRTNCLGCHQGAKNLGEYVMTQFDKMLAGGESGEKAIVPGNPDASHLIAQITPVDGHAEMPDEPAKPLAASEIELIRRWIAEGANDDSPAQRFLFDASHPPVYQNPPAITSIDVSPDGTLIAAAGYHEVFLIDAKSNQTLHRLIGASPRINSVRFSPDSSRLAVAGGTPVIAGEIQVWNVKSAELELSKSVTYDTLSGVRWSPDGKQISFGGGDNSVRAIDSTTGEQVLFQGAHEDWVLDTVYTVDGKHLVSVARDMTCKLTEVATERFIDNITSITPGALSGGLNSIERHPRRDELFLGGADGVAKVYRVFRQTERRIGDDANLVRQMPAMAGRIFSVAISPDGSRLAAAATLDGQSEIRVWNYDFDGTMTDDIKRLSSKRVADLSPEEKEKLDKYKNSPVTQIWRAEIVDAAVYSLRFDQDQSLLVAGTDGAIHRYDVDGKVTATIHPLDPSAIVANQQASLAFDPVVWATKQASSTEHASENVPETDQVTKLEIQPAVIQFNRPLDYFQLLITGTLRDGSTVDLTRAVKWTVPNFTVISPTGILRPITDGDGKLAVSFGGLTASVEAKAANIKVAPGAAAVPVDFIRDVNPVLSRLGCNQGTCHGAQAGKNGFKLSLRGYDPIFDLRALTDDHAARRVNSSDPDQSLMLHKPLGIAPHQGGTLMSTTDPSFAILRSWIADGCKLDLGTPRVTRIEFSPINPVVNQLGSRQQVRVVAHYADGLQRDVTAEAFITSGNTEVAEASGDGLLTAVRRGEAPILARYEGSYAATTLTVMGKREDFQWTEPPVWNRIDKLVSQKWQRMKIIPSELCSDEEFLRRVYLDLTGMPPSVEATREFLADTTETQRKRAALIDDLISSEDFVEYWTNKWADLLQVNRKFLGVEGSAAYRAWIRDSVARNQPYDEFVREILTAMGSNKDKPEASYYKVLRTAEETMENTTHLFLGIRFNCNKCHDHPFERWTQDQYYETAAFFSRTSLRADPASGKQTIGGSAVDGAKPLYEEVYEADAGEIKHQRTGKEVAPKFPYELPHDAKAEGNRRDQLAAWMSDADNPYFVRSYVNRIWGYMTGVGLIEPIDDIRAGNPPTNPELLEYLADSFVESGFDRRQLMRMICNSRTYQLSVKTNRWNKDDMQNYSHALPRRLSAEVLFDTVHAATGSTPDIPGVPKGTRAAELPDAGVKLSDGFLQSLGRPVRESACECERSSDLQLGPVMALVSGPTVGKAIADTNNELHRIVNSIDDDAKLVEEIFLRTLSRLPKASEIEVFNELRSEIGLNHNALLAALNDREAWWNEELPKREAAWAEAMKRAEEQLAAAIEAAKPEQERLAKEREAKIAEAQAKFDEVKAQAPARLAQWEKEQTDATEWFPLIPTTVNATSKDAFRVLEDRSIVVNGTGAKGVYNLVFNTSLKDITGIRIEALPMDLANGRGPGLADNSNFVLTELEVSLADKKTPKQSTPVVLTGGLADFSQSGFAPPQAIDGNIRDQKGWAVGGSTVYAHWIVFQTKEPIALDENKNLVVQLHQIHNADKHRLGRFRISFTTSKAAKLPLGLAEPYRSVVNTSVDQRTDAEKQLLSGYYESIDAALIPVQEALAAAKAPVPADAEVVASQMRLERAKQPIVVDATLERLRADKIQSELQVKNERLTATEDLVWALINSPDFLFNR